MYKRQVLQRSTYNQFNRHHSKNLTRSLYNFMYFTQSKISVFSSMYWHFLCIINSPGYLLFFCTSSLIARHTVSVTLLYILSLLCIVLCLFFHGYFYLSDISDMLHTYFSTRSGGSSIGHMLSLIHI